MLAAVAFAVIVSLYGCVGSGTVVVEPAPERPATGDVRQPEPEGVEITGVYAEPASVRPGDEVKVIAEYVLLGGGRHKRDVVEILEVRYDGVLTSMPTYTRKAGPGRYEFTTGLVVPSDAPAGRYDVSAYVSDGDEIDAGATTFTVH